MIKVLKYSSLLFLVFSLFSPGEQNTALAEAPLWEGSVTLGEPVIVSERVLVKLKVGATAEAFRDALESLNRRSSTAQGRVMKVLPYTRIAVVQIVNHKGGAITDLIEQLGKLEEVEYAEPDYIVHIRQAPQVIPNDSRFGELWGLHNTGQSGGVLDADIDAMEAWDITTGDPNVVIAVIDTGVDYTHQDLRDNMWVNSIEANGITGVDDDGNGYVDDIYGIDTANNDGDPMDDHNHGTHVSGTIGARGHNNLGVVGVNWRVQIMACKFLSFSGGGSLSDAIECLDYAIRMKTAYGVNLKLTSNSWGGGGFSQSLRDAIQASGDAGMLFVAAAGNDASDNDVVPSYPSSYDLDNIIAVAATTRADTLSSFSNYGVSSVDLGAPGSDILSTVRGNSYDTFSGTSMATPHVAGAAALLWAMRPNASPLEIKDILLSTVDVLDSLAGRALTQGRLNIHRALTCDESQVELLPSLAEGFSVRLQEAITVTVDLTACRRIAGATVMAQFNNGDPALTFQDNGVAPDQAANDGRYTATWTPGHSGAVAVTFTAVHTTGTYTALRNGNVVVELRYRVDDQYPFQWVDISGTGTRLNLSDDSFFYPIPFAFSFYNQDYAEIAIGSNGHVYFENSYLGYNNRPIPSQTSNTPQTFIAVFWDDLNPGTGGAVYYEVRGTAPQRQLIVQWDNVPHYPAVGSLSAQVMLDEATGNILMQYLDVQFGSGLYDNGASATVGLQRDPGYGQQYSYDQPALRNQMAIFWTRQEACEGPPNVPAQLQSPRGEVSDNTPAFAWEPVSCATAYRLWVRDATGRVRIDRIYQASDVCSGAQCAVDSSVRLGHGRGEWWIRPLNEAGTGPWGVGANFTIVLPRPGQARPSAPSGSAIRPNITFRWSPDEHATSYLLQVNDSEISATHVYQQYTAEALGCADGVSLCTVTPNVRWNLGNAAWWVRTQNSAGDGPWSNPLYFVVEDPPRPGVPTLISPRGTIPPGMAPTYTWYAVSEATWYYLEVTDSRGTRFALWYTRAATSCSRGEVICSINPGFSLAPGQAVWQVRGWNAAGTGAVSERVSFTISPSQSSPPPAPVLIAPSGTISTQTPTYSWNAVAGANGYFIWVNDSTSTPRIHAAYSAEALGCATGTGTCAVTPAVSLAMGNAIWWVRGWNNAGNGPWSGGLPFRIGP